MMQDSRRILERTSSTPSCARRPQPRHDVSAALERFIRSYRADDFLIGHFSPHATPMNDDRGVLPGDQLRVPGSDHFSLGILVGERA
jgi:hypothetical protein